MLSDRGARRRWRADDSTTELDDLTLLRYGQYQAGLADERAFQRQYMVPVHVPGRKAPGVEEGPGGGTHAIGEDLRKLEPVKPEAA